MITWDELNGEQQALLEDVLDEPTKLFYLSQQKVADELIEMGLVNRVAYQMFMASDYGRRVVAGAIPTPADSAPQPAAGDASVYSRGYIADHVASGDFESVWDVISNLQTALLNSQKGAISFHEMHQDAQQQIATLQAELAQARALLDDIAKLLPENRDHIGDGTRSANVAWNAAIAADKIREYKAQQAAPGAAK